MRTRIVRIAHHVLPVAVLVCALSAPLPAFAADPPYESAMRDQCTAELEKDKRWHAELRDSLRADVHQEDADVLMTNKRHVVIAYAALWGLTVLFVALLWLRQRRLVAEMDRLGRQIEKAAES